jgi:hypothetical protein
MSRCRVVVSGLVAAVLAGVAGGCVPEAPPDLPVVTSTPTPTVTRIDLSGLLVPPPNVARNIPVYGNSQDIAQVIATGDEVAEAAAYLDEHGFVRGINLWWRVGEVGREVTLVQFTDEENAEQYVRWLSRRMDLLPGPEVDIPDSRSLQDAQGTAFAVVFRTGVIVADVRASTRTPSTFAEAMGDLPERQYERLADYA